VATTEELLASLNAALSLSITSGTSSYRIGDRSVTNHTLSEQIRLLEYLQGLLDASTGEDFINYVQFTDGRGPRLDGL
jgi:hypothetical protein